MIVPAHPSRKGQYPNPGYLDLVWDMLMRILKERDCFGKITLCWSEERINPDVLRGMQQKNVEHIVANPWTDPEPLKHMIDQIEAADLVLSCNTTGCVAVARGKPTVFFSEGAPSSNPKAALHPEKYHHFLKFPLQAENMTIDDILAVRRKPNEQVEVWKEQNIGGNFNAAKFLGIIREYIPS